MEEDEESRMDYVSRGPWSPYAVFVTASKMLPTRRMQRAWRERMFAERVACDDEFAALLQSGVRCEGEMTLDIDCFSMSTALALVIARIWIHTMAGQ